MIRINRVIKLLLFVILVTVLGPALAARAAQKAASKQEGPVAGILFDLDRKNNWLTVKADGEDVPVKYLDRSLEQESGRGAENDLQCWSSAIDLQVPRATHGDWSSIQRQILQASGTVTGVVVNVHDAFWIELKPRRGVADAFAPGANYNDKAFMAKLKALKPGDSVTIRFTTDFERHRIVALRKNAVQGQPGSKTEPQGNPGKEKN